LTVEYDPADVVLDPDGLQQWLADKSEDEVSVSGFGRVAFDAIRAALGDIPLAVTLEAELVGFLDPGDTVLVHFSQDGKQE
jgi:hypothetical protein